MRTLGLLFSGLIIHGALSSTFCVAAPPERPTLNHTADPRPNILPDWIYNHHVPYRLQYNRPTYYGGKIAYHISPTSQEAMVWQENLAAGRYDGHNCPPLYKGFYYPKPWEVLNTGPRPTYNTKATATKSPDPDMKAAEQQAATQEADDLTGAKEEIVPKPRPDKK